MSIILTMLQLVVCRFDELIVGAPIYSDYDRNLQEIGQVYVFENTGVSTVCKVHDMSPTAADAVV